MNGSPKSNWPSLLRSPLRVQVILSVTLTLCTAMCLNAGDSDKKLDDAARVFRIRTYNQFRNNRNDYDRRIQRGEQIVESARNGERTVEEAIAELENRPIRIDASVSKPTPLYVGPPRTAPIVAVPVPAIVHAPSPPPTVPTQPRKLTYQRSRQGFAADATRDVTQTAAPPIGRPRREFKIDLDVLNARIESTNLRLETIEAQLHASAPRLYPDELEAVAATLDSAIEQHDLSATYYALLSETQRERVTPMAQVEPVLEVFSRRLFDSQIIAHEKLNRDGSVAHENDVTKLQDLSRRVKSWQNR